MGTSNEIVISVAKVEYTASTRTGASTCGSPVVSGAEVIDLLVVKLLPEVATGAPLFHYFNNSGYYLPVVTILPVVTAPVVNSPVVKMLEPVEDVVVSEVVGSYFEVLDPLSEVGVFSEVVESLFVLVESLESKVVFDSAVV